MAPRRAASLGLLVVLLLSSLVAPAVGQEPYPPPPPGEPQPMIECDLRVTPQARIAECEGRNLDPDTEITIEVTISGGQQANAAIVLAAASVDSSTESPMPAAQSLQFAQSADYEDDEEVRPDGTADVAVSIPCDEDGIATIRGEGVGENGEPVSDEIVRDLAAYPCPTDDPAAAPPPVTDDDAAATPGLAFTGADWLMLLGIALLLILAGVGILRSRQRRPA